MNTNKQFYADCSTQLSTLQGIAPLCPAQYGPAVFQARALLNRYMNTSIIFYDSCGTSSCEHKPSEHHVINGQTNSSPLTLISAKVYPNPANTLLNIEISLQQGQTSCFVMYNELGEEVQNIEIQNNLTSLPLINLPSGIYYYRITDNTGKLLKADKQLIIH